MAADLILPKLPGDLHQIPQAPNPQVLPQRPLHTRSLSYQVPHHPSSNQVSPLSSSDERLQASTTASSPNAYHARQARPLYMPAVLRPNSEFTAQKLTKGFALGRANTAGAVTERRLSGGSFLGMPGIAAISQRLGRRTTGDSAKYLEGDWDLDVFPDVTDRPTRQHWKTDAESTMCDDPTCKRAFNYFLRRHHCRRCGNIFCDQHSSFEIPLDQDANYNPKASPSRTCNHCFEQYKSWHSRHSSRTSSTASSDVNNGTPPTPVATAPNNAALGLPKSAEVAASVPRDWNWSTF